MKSLLIHYEDYEKTFRTTVNNLLDFLQLKMIVEEKDIPPFKPGKTYKHYYSKEQRAAASKFMMYWADDETMKLIDSYLK